MIRILLRLTILSLFILIGGVASVYAGQAESTSASIQATASVVYPVGITTLENTTSGTLPSSEVSSYSQICAPENRSILVILQIGNRDVYSQRIWSGRIPGVSGLLPNNELPIGGVDVEIGERVTVTLVDPDV